MVICVNLIFQGCCRIQCTANNYKTCCNTSIGPNFFSYMHRFSIFTVHAFFFYFSFFKIGYCIVDVWIFGNKMNCGMKYFDYLKAIYTYHIDLEWWFYWMVEAINDYASWCSQHLHPNSWTYWLLTYHAHCHCTVCSGANKYRYLNVSLVNRNHFGFVRMQKSSLAFFILMLLPINRNNMGGSSPDQWDNRMLDHLKNFDLSSPEVRQQFGEWVKPCNLGLS